MPVEPVLVWTPLDCSFLLFDCDLTILQPYWGFLTLLMIVFLYYFPSLQPDNVKPTRCSMSLSHLHNFFLIDIKMDYEPATCGIYNEIYLGKEERMQEWSGVRQRGGGTGKRWYMPCTQDTLCKLQERPVQSTNQSVTTSVGTWSRHMGLSNQPSLQEYHSLGIWNLAMTPEDNSPTGNVGQYSVSTRALALQ